MRVLLGLIVVAAALAACGTTEGADDKIAVVTGWVAASSQKNWEQAASY